MNLKEYEAKQIFNEYGIETPKGVLATKNKRPKVPWKNSVLKVQVLFGSRKKKGYVVFSDNKKIKNDLKEFFDKKDVHEVLIEEKLKIKKELYVALTIDRLNKCITLLLSKEGGVEIESLPKEKIVKFFIKNDKIDVIKKIRSFPFPHKLAEIINKMYVIMKEKDALLVEINPLAVADKKLVAADAKIIIDDYALYRQKFAEHAENKREELAKKHGMLYVELDGDIGIIGNGAGLVMSILDAINFQGCMPANFLDIRADANFDKMEIAMDIILHKKIRKLLINIFGGLTPCDEMALAIADYKKKHKIKIPMVVRLTGFNQIKAYKILEKAGIHPVKTMEEAVKKVVSL